MLKLLRNLRIYNPKDIGKNDILIVDSKICKIEKDLSKYASLEEVEVYDYDGAMAGPGYIDAHVHITGGGGEQGFYSRTPEIKFSELTSAGVTTVIGLLGTDGETRTIENLYAKACGLEKEGMSSYILTGSYAYPSTTLTGSVKRDIMFVDKVVGTKVALSDHRCSRITKSELSRLVADTRMGGILSGKAGLLVIHMGNEPTGISLLREIANENPILMCNMLPTHIGRTPELYKQAIEYMKEGGYVDFSVDLEDEVITAYQVSQAIKEEQLTSHMTLSTDSCGSMPEFDEKGNCTKITYLLPALLQKQIKSFVNDYGVPVEDALSIATLNVAKRYKIDNHKGRIREGYDADIIIYDKNFDINHVFAKGNYIVKEKESIVKGYFEK